MKEHLVKVVIPIYRPELKDFEAAALANNMKMLANFPIVFLKPIDIELTSLQQQYPQAELMSVSSHWLGTLKGIQGYNKMMMSADFYTLFADCEYILICHIDAWIFRNEVVTWCKKGYDHVAAPWPMRPRYNRFPLKQYLQLKLWLKPRRKILHCQMFNRIGNGGFSLRRVDAFHNACLQFADDIAFFNAQSHPLYNEDLFWALIPPLTVPTVEEALMFSFDLKPELSLRLNHGNLPMACHGFDKPVRRRFWSKYIPCIR